MSAGGITPATVPTYTNVVSATDSQVHNEVEATVQPIKIMFKYELIVDSVKEIDLTTTGRPRRADRARPSTDPRRRRDDRMRPDSCRPASASSRTARTA